MTASVAIIGSGPAALACVWQLLARGLRPVVLDAGERPSPATESLVRELRATMGQWREELVKEVTFNNALRGQPLPRKLVFGSDFLYGRERRHSPLVNDSFVDPTFALGGYTVGWGGALLPIRSVDMARWPITEADLEPGFGEVLARLPFSGHDDGLSAEFPLFGSRPQALVATVQASRVLARLTKLARPREFAAGQARVAVKATDCQYCGLCLSGCPLGAIQTFDQIFGALASTGQIDYRAGVVVTRLLDQAAGVQVQSVDVYGEPLRDMYFDRVFLAAGSIGSARIALESMKLYDTAVEMLDSQKFAVPLLVLDAQPSGPVLENALPAIFADMRLDSITPHWAHLQISSFGSYAAHAMKERLRLGPLSLHHLATPLKSRLMVGWGGLHSDHSDRFKLRLLRAHRHGRPILRIQPMPTAAIRKKTRRAIWEISRRLAPAGVLVLAPGAVIGPPGAGFHFGGSLPMRARPVHPLETDVQGKLACWRYVHVIDSSVFPSIPATTMVLSIMANAWRITKAVAL